MFITALVLFLCFFSFMLFFSYSYENYISLYGVPSGVEEIISMLNVMFGIEYVVPFNVVNLLTMQLNTFWWAYLFYFAVMLVILTGRKSDDFKNMEQGSALWATLEDNPVFTKRKEFTIQYG